MKDTKSAPVVPSRESVADCIARLGLPPDDIWRQWVDEARGLLAQPDAKSLETDDPVWAQLLVDENGHLVVGPRLATNRREDRHASTASETDSTDEIIVPMPDEAPGSVGPQPKPIRQKGAKRNRIVVAVAVVAAGVVLGIALRAGPDAKLETAPSARSLASVPDNDTRTSRPPAPQVRQRSVAATPTADPIQMSDQLDTVMADVPNDADSINNQLRSSGLSLDAFLPPEMLGSPESPNSQRPDANAPAVDSLAVKETFSGEIPSDADTLMPADLFSDDPESTNDAEANLENESDENADEQTTVTRDPIAARKFGIALPPVPSRNETPLPEPIELIRRDEASDGSLPDELTISFPPNLSGSTTEDWVRLDAGGEPLNWNLVDIESSIAIAKIIPSEDQASLRFAWSEAARQWSPVTSLTHGRITTDLGDTIFLRPSLDGEPIRLGLAKRDIKLKWSLQTPVAPNATQLSLDVVVPQDVDLEWIEPIDNASPRNTRGVLMLKLKKTEETAIVVRLDVKTTQSLSLRMRFGARLHPTMPWQWTDATSIRTSLTAVTNQLEAADRQLLDLDVAITRAERMRARRQEYLLEDQRDRIDEAVKGWTIVAKRLAELDQLVAFLKAGAEIRPKLSVPWPDEEQVLFAVGE